MTTIYIRTMLPSNGVEGRMHAEGLANDEYGAKQTRESDDEKVIPMFEEKHIDVTGAVADDSSSTSKDVSTSKKAKHRSRQNSNSNSKLRVTVPQPFSLEIDKRMSRGRRAANSARFGAVNEERVPQERCGSLELKKPRPGLSKSVGKWESDLSTSSCLRNHPLNVKREEHFSRARPKVATLDDSSAVSMDLSSTQEKQVRKQRFISAGPRNPKPPAGLPKSVTLNHKSVSTVNAEECSQRTHQNPRRQATNKSRLVSQVKATEHVDQKPFVTACSKSPDNERSNRPVCKMETQGNMKQSESIATSAKKTFNQLLKNTRRVLGTPKAGAN